jgi:hypothetical protein
MTYVRTSKRPEDRAKYRHLTGLVIEKGTPGFSVEKVNELMAYDGIYNGYLSFNNARVPVANRLGEEERIEAINLIDIINNPATEDKDRPMARLSELFTKADTYAQLPHESEVLEFSEEINRKAGRMQKS